ncbi:MAG: adenylate kinase [Spirochaetes bacterium RBG_13_68_11]|nr:MAG: adenylate kinase [Spirochaetes bacterium RBG_13_68_11]
MNLIFLGPPGAGKGTLAGLVAKELGIPQISTGDIFRDAIKRETELGKQVKAIVGRGDLVPDELTVSLVRERLARPDAAKGYILDGFPRTIPQAEALEGFQKHDAVVNFVIGDDIVVLRLTGREVCRACGAIYHVRNMPTKVKGVCDRCGGQTYTRPDDTLESIKNRLEVYKRQTEPLIAFYRKRGLLRDVDSSTTPEATLAGVRAVLGRGA